MQKSPDLIKIEGASTTKWLVWAFKGYNSIFLGNSGTIERHCYVPHSISNTCLKGYAVILTTSRLYDTDPGRGNISPCPPF